MQPGKFTAKTLSLLFVFLLTGAPLSAMPPHPSKLDAIKAQGPVALQRLKSRLIGMQQRGMDRPKRTFPTTGNRKVLVLLIQYSDSAMDGNSTATFYSNLFNGATSDALSWRKYYQDMSNGALNLTFDVKGPYTAANTLSYYGGNDAQGYDLKPATLVGEAIDAAESAGTDFTLYDNDNDGEVDVVIVIHAGVGEESSQSAPADAIWSHAWNLDSGNYYGDGSGARTYDGKTINEYAIQPEYVSSPGDSTIGVFCHEFGHVLGLPDMYDTSYATGGVGDFSLMAGGSWLGPSGQGSRPAPLLAWEKKQLGWITLKAPDGTVLSSINKINRTMVARTSAAPVLPLIWLGVGFGLGGMLMLKKKYRNGKVFIIPFLIIFLVFPMSVTIVSCSDDDTATVSSDSTSSDNSQTGSINSTSSDSSQSGSTDSTSSAGSQSSSAGSLYTETFDNLGISSSSYTDGNFTGTASVNWTYTEARGDQTLDGKAICLAKDTTAKLTGTLPAGCGDLSFKFKQTFSTAVNFSVYINDQLKQTVSSGTEDTVSFTLNTEGFVKVEIRQNSGGGQVTIDSISWNNYGTAPSSSSGSSQNSSDSSTASSDSSTASSDASSSSASVLTVSVADIETSYTAVKIPLGDPNGKQYLLIENKQKTAGTWTEYLPGSGLLITHIHDDVTAAFWNANEVNDGATRIHGVNIIEADNNGELWTSSGYGESTDLFAGRSYNNTTSPKPFYYTGTSTEWNTSGKVDSTVQINNISASGSTMTFDFSN